MGQPPRRRMQKPMRTLRSYEGSRLVAGIGVVAVAMMLGAGAAAAIDWVTRGPFEVCVESSLEQWLREQAELVVNEDPAAIQLDDAVVAAWTVDTMRQCRARAGTPSENSEVRFGNYMARWRQDVFDVAAEIRKKGQSD
jgi:hypothetical protein